MTVHSAGLSPGDLNTTTSSTPSTGTPPSQGTRISPGVYINDTDVSSYAPNQAKPGTEFIPAYHVFAIQNKDEVHLVATVIITDQAMIEQYRQRQTINIAFLFSLHIKTDHGKYYHLKNCRTENIIVGEPNQPDSVQVLDGKTDPIPTDELHVVLITKTYDELILGQQVSPPVF